MTLVLSIQPSTYQRAMPPKIARCLSFYYPEKHKRKIHLLSLLLGSCPIHSFPCLLSSWPNFPESRRHAWSLGYLLLCLKYNWNSFSDTHTWICSSSQTLGSRFLYLASTSTRLYFVIQSRATMAVPWRHSMSAWIFNSSMASNQIFH